MPLCGITETLSDEKSVGVVHFKAQDLGIKELNGDANKSEAALADIEAFGASIK